MRIICFLILMILSGCNSQTPQLSPISNIANGLFISSISSQSTGINVSFSVPFQISDPKNLLTCNGSVSITTDNTTLFPTAGMSLSGTAPNCLLTVTSGLGQTGIGNITLAVTNGTDTSTSLFPVFVASQVPPSPSDIGTLVSFAEDTEQIFTLPYTDANGDLGTSCIVTLPANVIETTPCSCNAGGVCTVGITGIPNYNSGALQFQFRIADNDGISPIATANFMITPVNDAPTISAVVDYSYISNSLLTYTIPFSISDVENLLSCSTSVTATSSNALVATNAQLSWSGVGMSCNFNITPNVNTIGTTTITLTVSDGSLSASETFNVTLTGWGQEAYIKASNPSAEDLFGEAIAIDGDTLVVGSPREDSPVVGVTNGTTAAGDVVNANYGAAYVFRRTGTTWVQEAYLKADSINSLGVDDDFGLEVAVSRDIIAVGVPREDSLQTNITPTASADNTSADSGAVYIYRRTTGSTWVQEAFIKAELNATTNAFGGYLSLSHDTLAVGVPNDDSGGNTIISTGGIPTGPAGLNSGATYLYKRSALGAWAREAYIKADNPDSTDAFGGSVSLEGNLLAVGATEEDSNQIIISTAGSADDSFGNSGAAYVYARSGATWTQEAYIKAPNNNGSDRFGFSLSLSNNRLAVGAPLEDSNTTGILGTASPDNLAVETGAVYIFKRTSGVWQFENYIKYPTVIASLQFGKSVSLKGNTLAVGIDRDSSASGRIVNAASFTPSGTLSNSGSTIVYHFNGSSWVQDAYLKAINLNFADFFGHRVAVSGDTIAVSTVNEDSNQNFISNSASASTDNSLLNSGVVYIFRNNARLFEVTEVWASSSNSVIELNWQNPGGTTSDFVLKYAQGTTAPGACNRTVDIIQTGISYSTASTVALTPNTDYTFRICASNGTLMTEGKVLTVKTSGTPVLGPIVFEAGL